MPDTPSSLRALIDVGISLVRRTATGTVGLARYEPLVYPELIPAAYRTEIRAELERARAAAIEPLDRKVIDKATKPFDDVSKEPLAVTPAAQVHRAELDGEPVAVKVARPGVAGTVHSELSLLDVIVMPSRMVFPKADIAGVLTEVRETALDELDLEHEGETQHQVRRALRRVDGVTVPAVHIEECEPERLVTELLNGPTLQEATPEDPAAVARALIAAHLTAWREAGLVLTDARPSHVVLLEGGGIGLLGAGLARPVPRERCEAGVAAFVALSDPDSARFVAAVADLGVLPEDAAGTAHALLREVLGDLVNGGPATLDGPALAAAGERALERIGDLVRLGAQVTPDPTDLAAVRMLGQLTATLSVLGVTEDWTALAGSL
jgi:ubiquinone biosynthesis protein